MKHPSGLLFCSLGFLLALAISVRAQDPPYEYKLGNDEGTFGDMVEVGLTLNSEAEVQGLQAIFDWDDTGDPLDGANIIPGPAITNPPMDDGNPGADVIVRRAEGDFMLLGVVMDNNGEGVEVIPPGQDILIATFQFNVKLLLAEGDAPVVVPFAFQDKKYSADEAGQGPTLDNIIVVGGMSLGDCAAQTSGDCIVLPADGDGYVRIVPPPPGKFAVKNTSGFFGSTVAVPVLLSNSTDVQGYVIALKVEMGGRPAVLEEIAPSTAGGIAMPEFKKYDAFPAANGGALSAIMEYNGVEPFLVIPPGDNVEVAVAMVSSAAPASDKSECGLQADYAVQFTDEFQIDPTRTRENMIVVGGKGVSPETEDGTLSLSADQTVPPCRPEPEFAISYAVGGCDTVTDPDLGIQVPADIEVVRGPMNDQTSFQVGLYYQSPPGDLDENDPTMPQTNDHIQGVSMALKFNQKCLTCDGTVDLTGTITQAVGAEFVNVLCENSPTNDGESCPDDGDGGELVVGILVDALPPFDGKDLPPTLDFLKLVCVGFHVNPTVDWNCAECQNTPLHLPKPFVLPDPFDGGDDGVDVLDDGCGSSPLIRNLASVRTRALDPDGNYITQQISVKPQLFDGVVRIRDVAEFIRGDCNWSDMGSDDPHSQGAVDISDAAAVVSFLFYTGTWQWQPPCMDACDANDDGRIDLADAVYILRYMFMFDDPPPPPFPNFGVDPTADRLTCAEVKSCGEEPDWTPDP